MTKPKLHIHSLTVENIRNIKTAVLTFDPHGGLVQIVGRNGSGKSTLLDSAAWLFLGKRAIDLMPIREGETEGRITGNFGELIVTLSLTADGGHKLVVRPSDPKLTPFAKPQDILSALIGELTFDAGKFLLMAAKDQLEEVRRVVPLDVDVDALDALNTADYNERTQVNREGKSAVEREAVLLSGCDPLMDVAPIEEDSLLEELTAAGKHNADVVARTSERQRLIDRSNSLLRERDSHLARAKQLRAEADDLEAGILLLVDEARTLSKQVDVAIPAPIDTDEIRGKVDEARRENTRRRLQAEQRAKHAEAQALVESLRAASKGLTTAIDARVKAKADALARAEFPVPGMSFGPEGVLLNGRPFSQAEHSLKLRASVKLGMLANPGVKVVFVHEGSGIGPENLQMIAEMAAAEGYTVLVERLTAEDGLGLVFEMADGAVVNG